MFAALQDSKRGALALQGPASGWLPALEDLPESLRASSSEVNEAVTLDRLSLLLGPELRIGVPILVQARLPQLHCHPLGHAPRGLLLALAARTCVRVVHTLCADGAATQVDLSGAVQLDGPATPDGLSTLGEVKLDSGVFNVLATQFNVDHGHRNTISFTGETGLNPIVDVALVSGNFRISCLVRGQSVQHARGSAPALRVSRAALSELCARRGGLRRRPTV